VELVNCDFCGAGDNSLVTEQSDKLHNTTTKLFKIVKCNRCGLQYTNPRPSADEIGEYYSKNYVFHSNSSLIHRLAIKLATKIANSPISVLVNLVPIINKKFIPYIKPNISDPVHDYYDSGGKGTFLDIGCGAGVNAHFWGESGSLLEHKKNIDVAGIEVSARARKTLTDTGIESWGSLDEVPDERRFSVIRMNWSLEHVHSPSEYFEFFTKHLAQDGRLIISVPNYNGLIYKIASNCVELPIHLYHFTPHDMYNYAERFKLNIKSLVTFSYPQMFITAAEFGLFPESFSKKFSFNEARFFQKTLERFDSEGFGNDMVVVLEFEK